MDTSSALADWLRDLVEGNAIAWTLLGLFTLGLVAAGVIWLVDYAGKRRKQAKMERRRRKFEKRRRRRGADPEE